MQHRCNSSPGLKIACRNSRVDTSCLLIFICHEWSLDVSVNRACKILLTAGDQTLYLCFSTSPSLLHIHHGEWLDCDVFFWLHHTRASHFFGHCWFESFSCQFKRRRRLLQSGMGEKNPVAVMEALQIKLFVCFGSINQKWPQLVSNWG